MARSYGSFFRQQDLDKPYRGAELALGFLGDILASKNKAALGYEALAQEATKAEELKQYRELSLESKTFTDPTTGQSFSFDVETGGYTTPIGAGGTPTNWGKIYGDDFFDRYLSGNVEYEDADKDGVPDKTYVGPEAALWRNYQTAKAKNTPGWEDMSPEKVVAEYSSYKGNDPTKIAEINKYFEGIEDYQTKYNDFQQISSLPPGTKDTQARSLLKTLDEKYKPKKLAYADKTSIQGLMNEKEKYVGWLTGATKITRYSGADLWGSEDTGDLTRESESIKAVVLTDDQRENLKTKIKSIEDMLGVYGVKYIPYEEVNPLDNTAPWLK